MTGVPPLPHPVGTADVQIPPERCRRAAPLARRLRRRPADPLLRDPGLLAVHRGAAAAADPGQRHRPHPADRRAALARCRLLLRGARHARPERRRRVLDRRAAARPAGRLAGVRDLGGVAAGDPADHRARHGRLPVLGGRPRPGGHRGRGDGPRRRRRRPGHQVQRADHRPLPRPGGARRGRGQRARADPRPPAAGQPGARRRPGRARRHRAWPSPCSPTTASAPRSTSPRTCATPAARWRARCSGRCWPACC